MADGKDSGGGLGKLLVGGGVAWLVWQWAQSQGLVGGPCPPNTVQVRLADGSMRCVPPSQIQGGGGGLSTGQVVQIIGLGLSVVGTVVSIGAGIAKAVGTGASASGGAAGAGAGVATATSTATSTTSVATSSTSAAVDTAASAAEDVASELIPLGLDASFTAALGYMAILYALAEITTSIAQWVGGIVRNRARADREAPTNFETILYNEQAAFDSFVQKLIGRLNTTIQQKAVEAGQPAVYPNLNQQAAPAPAKATAGYGGYIRGVRGRLSRFGAAVMQAPARLAPKTAALSTSPAAQLMAALAAGAGPNSGTPYFYEDAGYAGGRNDLGTTIQYCAGAGTYCYYLTKLDPRLPVAMLRDYRGMLRWMFWLQEKLYNSTMRAYWDSRLSAENGVPECPGQTAIACLNKMTVDPSQFDAAVSAYYASVPASELLPVAYQTFKTYEEVQAVAFEYIQSLNAAAKAAGAPLVDFNKMRQGLIFNGVAQAVCQAAQIGFGGWWSPWPGDLQFTQMIWQATGLSTAGWAPPRSVHVFNPQYGNADRWLIQDPVTGWYIDVVGSRDAKTPMCYRLVHEPPAPDAYAPLSGFREGNAKRPRIAVPIHARAPVGGLR